MGGVAQILSRTSRNRGPDSKGRTTSKKERVATMTKRQTPEEFAAKHPGATWTAKCKGYLQKGFKRCTKCSRDLDLSCFPFRLTGSNPPTMKVCSWCRDCQLKRSSQNYKARINESTLEILNDDFCDCCGESGASWFWRNISDGGFFGWVGLHKHCIQRARETGLISKKAIVKPKSTLKKRLK